MLLYWLIFIIICCSAFKNWKKTVIVWLPLQLLFNECICLKYTSPAVSLTLAIDSLLIFLYFFRNKKRLNMNTFFLNKVFYIYILSYILSMVFSIVPFTDVATNTIKYFIQTFGIVMIFYRALNEVEDIKLFIKTTLIVIISIVSLGVYEIIFKDNIILDYVFMNAPLESIKGKMWYIPPFLSSTGELVQRYGLTRCYSFFSIHIDFGCACVLLFFLYLFLLNYKYKYMNKSHLILFILLLAAGVLFSNSKTPLVGIAFFLLAFYKIKLFFNLKLLLITGIVSIVIYNYAPGYIDNFVAIFDDNVAYEGGGSTTMMRQRQFEIGLNLFSENPLLGNGIGSIAVFMKNTLNAELYGSESSWLKILIERGILGCIVYIYLYIIMFRKLKKYLKLKETVCFLMGLIAMETATGFMNFSLYVSIIIVICRCIDLKIVNFKQLYCNNIHYNNDYNGV